MFCKQVKLPASISTEEEAGGHKVARFDINESKCQLALFYWYLIGLSVSILLSLKLANKWDLCLKAILHHGHQQEKRINKSPNSIVH